MRMAVIRLRAASLKHSAMPVKRTRVTIVALMEHSPGVSIVHWLLAKNFVAQPSRWNGRVFPIVIMLLNDYILGLQSCCRRLVVASA